MRWFREGTKSDQRTEMELTVAECDESDFGTSRVLTSATLALPINGVTAVRSLQGV
jgi:hypothetical protein